MNAQSTAVAERRPSQIEVLKSTVARKSDDFKMVLPSHITVDKFQRTIATAALSNPQLLECDRQSLLIASMKLAQDGLLPDGREAALVPFKVWNKDTRQTTWQVQSMPMVYGLRKKILQSGEVLSLQVGVVYADEVNKGFLYEIGMEPPVRHRPDLFAKPEDRTDDLIVAAYSIARIKNGDAEPLWSVEVMTRHEINKVRQASQTGAEGRTKRDGSPIPPKGPWVDWFAEMAKKTVLRRHSKMLPMSGDLLDTFERDDAEEQRAQGAARLLEAQETAPPILPANSDLNDEDDSRINQETGEIDGPTDSRGMTEVDEQAARALDAREQGDAQVDAPEADHYGSRPTNAKHGESWWDEGAEKLRWAVETQNGLKWYLQKPAPLEEAKPEPTSEQASQSQAAAETAANIEGPLEQKSEEQNSQSEEQDETPAWQGAVDKVRQMIANAKDKKALTAADGEFVKIMAGLPDEVQAELQGLLNAARRKLAEG